MEYDLVKERFRNGNMIKSLNDGIVKKYSGFLTMLGERGVDSFNYDLIVYQDGIFAEVVEQGIDMHEEHLQHINNVLDTCKRLNVTTGQLVRMDYMKELK